MIKYLKLESEAEFVYEKIQHTEVCSIGFWFRNGSVDENTNEKGYAHFIEHILFKGTDTRTTSEIARCFDRIGSNFNAFTEKEVTCFYCTFPSKHLEYAVELLSDILFHPLFDNSEIKKEKNVIISEIHEYEELPEDDSYDIFLQKMWDPYPLGYKITGEVADIKKIKRDALYAYYSERYNAKNLVISAAGAFNEAVLIDLLNRLIPQTSHAPDGKKLQKPEYIYSFEYYSNISSKQIHIHSGLAFPTPAEMKDYYVFLFFSTLAGESMSSRLFQKLREDEGFCYSIYSFRSIFNYYSMWNIYANTAPEMLDDFMGKLNEELDKLADDPFKNAEIEDARTHLEGGLILSQEDMEIRMKRLARHYMFSGKSYDFRESLDILYSVSPEDIKIFLNDNLIGKNFNTLIYGDTTKLKCKDYNIAIRG